MSSGPPGRPSTRSTGPARGACFRGLRKPELSSFASRRERSATRERRGACRAGERRPARPRRGSPASGSSNGSGMAALGWILLSFLAFAVSAQLQAFKLSGDAKSALHGNPFLLPSPQTILVLGTDARPPDTKEPGAAPSQECFEQQSHGDAPHDGCSKRAVPRRHADADPRRAAAPSANSRSRATASPKSPARDPQKINAAFAFGGAALQIKTVEKFLGIKIDHVAIIDFTGFEDLIDAVGGVEVDVPHKLCADISGGAGGGQGGITLRLGKGENTLDGQKALAYAAGPRAERMPGPRQERLHPRLQRLRPREGPAGGDQRDQGPAHRPAAHPLQLHQGPDHRLGGAESLRQRHGLLHDAAAGPRRGDRRRLPKPTCSAAGRTPAANPGRKARSKCPSPSGAGR